MKQPVFWVAPPSSSDAILKERIDSLYERLQHIGQAHTSVVLASSLAAEDMVITHAIAKLQLPIGIFTLNTGLLHDETLALLAQLQGQSGLNIRVYTPDAEAASQFVAEYGRNAMYQSMTLRRQCCHIRKMVPLNRALLQADAWITGQRREQAPTRGQLSLQEDDAAHQMVKYNPLFDWQQADVWAYIRYHHVPVSALYQQGYPSIGCAPCTKPVRQGEDIRAGRWWWESADSKECGLHPINTRQVHWEHDENAKQG